MELTPDLLLEAKFSAARRGYDMGEVDDFLERCAEGLDVLLARLRAEFERAERAEAEVAALRAALDGGMDPASFAPGPEQEAAPDDEAGTEVAPPAEAPAAVGEPMRILIHAERTAEAAIAEARAEAERIRSEAASEASTQRSEAETLLERARAEAEAEARRAGDEARRVIQGEVVTLQRDRDSLTEDIRLLRGWLDDQRARMRSTARDLQRLADDPSALRDVAVPETSDAPTAEVGDDEEPYIDDEESDGEPTQAVPAVDHAFDRPFDDDDPSTDGTS